MEFRCGRRTRRKTIPELPAKRVGDERAESSRCQSAAHRDDRNGLTNRGRLAIASSSRVGRQWHRRALDKARSGGAEPWTRPHAARHGRLTIIGAHSVTMGLRTAVLVLTRSRGRHRVRGLARVGA